MSCLASILLLSSATTWSLPSPPYFLLWLPPQLEILRLVEMEAGWGNRASSVIFKINLFFFFFFCTLFPSPFRRAGGGVGGCVLPEFLPFPQALSSGQQS